MEVESVSAPTPEEMREGLTKTKGKIEEWFTWDAIYPSLRKLYNSQAQGWATVDSILNKIAQLGGDITSGKIVDSFATLNDEGKAQFAQMVTEASK